MNDTMLGYDKDEALAYILPRVKPELPLNDAAKTQQAIRAMIDAHIRYLHVCGALDEAGDTGEGEYDEDDAFEFILDAVSAGCTEDEKDALASLVLAFLPCQDDFMDQMGLLGE